MNLYSDLKLQQMEREMDLQNLAPMPHLHSKADITQEFKNAKIAIDIKNLEACSYATESAFFNVKGIVSADSE